jgi:hypothetical protein
VAEVTYREVFKTKPESDPGEVFYTITREDIGRTTIVTDAGPIYLNQVIGRVLDADVGIRLYRIPGSGNCGWHWTAESRTQRNDRLKLERKLERKLQQLPQEEAS